MAYKKLVIDKEKIYESNSCGPFKILDYMGRDEKSRSYVKIRFINTGTEKNVRYDLAMDGRIRDDLYGIDFNKIYDSIYYGQFKIIDYVGRNKDSKKVVKIKFLNTGMEYDVELRNAEKGFVKDYSIDHCDKKFSPSSENYNEYLKLIIKGRWKSMMERCYNEKCESYKKYGKLGVTVCDYWKSFDNYIYSLYYLYNFNKFYNDPSNYQLDKDYLQFNVPKQYRVYSPQTCLFLSIYDNANLAILENHKPNTLYGIHYNDNNTYTIEFSIDGKKSTYGTYNNIIAAANDYNYYYSMYAKYELVPLFNTNIPYIPHEVAQTYLINKNQ